MKKRWLALALLGALVLGCAVPALAEETERKENTVQAESSAAGPDDREDRKNYVPDEVGFISFENIERRMRKENLKIQMMDETINTLDEMDYESIRTQLETGLAMIDEQIFMLEQAAQMEPIGAQAAISSLRSQAAELESQLKEIKNGNLEEDNYGVIMQLENSQELLVMAGETTFIALKAMETQEGALQRQLAALNRTVEEMELRYQMGQISALQLQEVKAGRSSLISGLSTLRMNVKSYKAQLEQFLGADITGEITLGAVPTVSQAQLAAMDEEADWEKCRRQSYDIYSAWTASVRADDERDEAEKTSGEDSYEYLAASNSASAAEYTYDDTLQSCELKFRTLYAQVKDYQQIYETAKISLACQQESYKAAQLRYEQGTISENALLAAEDELRTAEEKVANAANDLFASYNTYCWAVQHGILN